MEITKNAIVLSSGGLDSTTVIAIAKDMGFKVYSLSFDYGQRHKYELNAARDIAKFFNVEKHLVIDINLRKIGGSALTDDIDVPDADTVTDEIPITYVPARNTIFLSYAMAWAEVLKASDIFIGVNAVDYSGYPDCRPEFIKSFEMMANLATKTGVEGTTNLKIQTPLQNLSKSEIIKKGVSLGIDYSKTISCYNPTGGLSCGKCDSCHLRMEGFRKANIEDPTNYVI